MRNTSQLTFNLCLDYMGGFYIRKLRSQKKKIGAQGDYC